MTSAAIKLAAAQLSDLEALSSGALEVLDRPGDGDDTFLISIDTDVTMAADGIRVRSRERFQIVVHDAFPYAPPSVTVDHHRWVGSPHVQWGRQLCLYAAPSVEWVPADGMRGFLDRLLTWLERAAAGTLDPDDQPLHPPVAYETAIGCVIIQPNLGHRVPWASGTGHRVVRQFAWCIREGDRIDVRHWLTTDQLVDRVNRGGASSANPQGKPYFVALAVLIADELGWEYPSKADQLAEDLSQAGYSQDALVDDLAWTNQANQILRSRDETAAAGTDPVVMLLGTPSRRITGTARLAHLVAWRLDQFGEAIMGALANGPDSFTKKVNQQLRAAVRQWLSTTQVRWMPVYNTRSEITQRRDQGTAISWLGGKHVLVLGCGALGAPVAEYCVRAGGTRVTVLDHSTVTPGILVRQPYRDDDIGRNKADALANRLNTISSKPTAHSIVDNAVPFVLDNFDPSTYDLIVDATADSGVRAALERAHRTHPSSDAPWPPTVAMVIGHQADLGLLTVARPTSTGTGHDVLRRTMLRARRAELPGWQDIIADFFPDPPRTDMFFPEPGCSAPTFVGSAADVTALAASMLTEAVRVLSAEQPGEAMTAIAIRQPRATHGRHRAAAESLCWPNDIVSIDSETGYDVRISAEAMSEIRTEVRRGARVRGPHIETGGMLLGAIDESTGVINIDLATGPPPDSKLSSTYFDHGTAGTQDSIDHHLHRSGGVTGFLGIWHTHPSGLAAPSEIDLAGMAALTNFTSTANKALMVILGGPPQVWTAWTDADGQPDIYVRVVKRDPAAVLVNATPPTERVQEAPPSGRYFSGGFSAPLTDPPPLRRRWLWWRRR